MIQQFDSLVQYATNVQIDYGNWWLIGTTFDLLLTYDPNLALVLMIPT